MINTKTSTRATSHRLDIDGLRALAVMLVLVFHFQLVSLGEAGFIGVDVFFVISGFLITSIIYTQFNEGRFSLRAFYTGRVRRLAPALFATLMLTMIAGAILLLPRELSELSLQAFWSQLYGANFYYWRQVNYFGLPADGVYLLHTWSLCVEEQFYLLYPLAIFCLFRWARKWFWPSIAILMCISFALNIMFVSIKPEATFYLLPTRAWELLAGAFVSWARNGWQRTKYVNGLLGIGGLALIAIAIYSHRPDTVFPGAFALLPVAGSAALILAGESASSPASRLLSFRPFVYIGLISYPLYLVHWPINVFAQQVLNEGYTFPWRIAMFGLSIILAALLYHMVELPVRQRKVLALNTLLLRTYASGVVSTVVFCVVALQTGGLPQRFPDQVTKLAAYGNDRSPPLTECQFDGRTPVSPEKLSVCAIGVANKTPRWLVYGDSHAWALHAAFDDWLKARGEAGVFTYRHGCPPLTGVGMGDGGRCYAFNESVIEYLRRRGNIDHVALVSCWMQSKGPLSRNRGELLSLEASSELFSERFAETISTLHGMGKQIYLWEPVPGAKQNVPQTLANAVRYSVTATNLEFSREQYRSTFSGFFSALDRSRAQIARIFSPSDMLCQSGNCSVTWDGVPLYFDNAHMTQSTYKVWEQVLQRSAR